MKNEIQGKLNSTVDGKLKINPWNYAEMDKGHTIWIIDFQLSFRENWFVLSFNFDLHWFIRNSFRICQMDKKEKLKAIIKVKPWFTFYTSPHKGGRFYVIPFKNVVVACLSVQWQFPDDNFRRYWRIFFKLCIINEYHTIQV